MLKRKMDFILLGSQHHPALHVAEMAEKLYPCGGKWRKGCGAAVGFAEPLAGAGSENKQNAGSVTQIMDFFLTLRDRLFML